MTVVYILCIIMYIMYIFYISWLVLSHEGASPVLASPVLTFSPLWACQPTDIYIKKGHILVYNYKCRLKCGFLGSCISPFGIMYIPVCNVIVRQWWRRQCNFCLVIMRLSSDSVFCCLWHENLVFNGLCNTEIRLILFKNIACVVY